MLNTPAFSFCTFKSEGKKSKMKKKKFFRERYHFVGLFFTLIRSPCSFKKFTAEKDTGGAILICYCYPFQQSLERLYTS